MRKKVAIGITALLVIVITLSVRYLPRGSVTEYVIDGPIAEEDVQVLTERLNKILPSPHSRPEIDRGNAIIRIHGDVPEKEKVFLILSGKGSFKIVGQRGMDPIITNSDIRRVEYQIGKDLSQLNFSLTQEAGMRLYQFSQANIGSRIRVYIDDIKISEVDVDQPLGLSFILTQDAFAPVDIYAAMASSSPLSRAYKLAN